jgi:molecular chaperone GrpE
MQGKLSKEKDMSNTDPQEQPDNELPLEETAAPAQEAAPDETAGLKAALAETHDKMMRALAEAENTRRRAKQEREDASKFAVASFAKDMLEFSNNFGRALAAIPDEVKADPKIAAIADGISAMERELLKVFERHGIAKMEPLDQPFNPNFHEVMFEAPVPGKQGGTVIQVVEAGYTLNGRLLRAAKVGVAKADDSSGGHQVDQEA